VRPRSLTVTAPVKLTDGQDVLPPPPPLDSLPLVPPPEIHASLMSCELVDRKQKGSRRVLALLTPPSPPPSVPLKVLPFR